MFSMRQQIWGFAACLLTACTHTPVPEKDRLIAQINAQECAIHYGALPIMRKQGLLADPMMIAGCPAIKAQVVIDLAPRPDVGAPKSKWTEPLYRSLIMRRMQKAFADQVLTSKAFAEWVRLREQLEALGGA